MGLTVEEAYGILQVSKDSSYNSVLKSYKRLALEWFPDKHNLSTLSLEKFQKISLAILKLSLPNKYVCESITLTEMFSLFQQIFFGNDKCCNDTGDGGSDTWGDEDYESDGDYLDNVDYSDDDYDAVEEKIVITEQVREDILKIANPVRRSIENSGGFGFGMGKCIARLEAAKNAKALIEEEEREKKKAERRKAKKKRRKEKKKQEKANEKHHKNKNGDVAVTENSTDAKCIENAAQVSSSDSEEDIDTTSAFVAVIANKNKKQFNAAMGAKILQFDKHKTEKEDDKGQERSRILRSRQLAIRGNEMANLGHFQEAVNLFSEAIKLDPADYRFFGNRSYCFDRLGHFQRALKDAEKSIAYAPEWPKGHFRKGRALIGLKEFANAEKCFEEVLKFDKECEDARSELSKVKVLQITEMGFTKTQAEAAIAQYSNVQAALEVLLSGAFSKVEVNRDLDIFVSDGEVDSESEVPVFKPKPVGLGLSDQKMDPRNLEGHESLWVGNISPDCTEKMVMSLFSKYGELRSVRRLPEKFCAFVNYKDKSSAGKAMQALQGKELLGVNILIRFPNNPGETGTVLKKPKPGTTAAVASTSSVVTAIGQTNAKLTGPVNGDECYFWRTTGCIYAELCKFKHIKAHKGIDKKNLFLKPS